LSFGKAVSWSPKKYHQEHLRLKGKIPNHYNPKSYPELHSMFTSCTNALLKTAIWKHFIC
jgi:hypothetical protein